VKAEMS